MSGHPTNASTGSAAGRRRSRPTRSILLSCLEGNLNVAAVAVEDAERQVQLTGVADLSLGSRLSRAGVAELGEAIEVVEVTEVDLVVVAGVAL